MHTDTIKSHIFYRHRIDETDELSQAVIPLATYIASVGSTHERRALKHILGGKYFTGRDAGRVISMLYRACKYARTHLDEVFPLMRADVLIQITILEETTARYQRWFNEHKRNGHTTVS
jgi:hypothetical protein